MCCDNDKPQVAVAVFSISVFGASLGPAAAAAADAGGGNLITQATAVTYDGDESLPWMTNHRGLELSQFFPAASPCVVRPSVWDRPEDPRLDTCSPDISPLTVRGRN